MTSQEAQESRRMAKNNTETPQVIAIYGGSFNPPHVGHAMVASWLVWTGMVDKVWLLPVYHHAFEGIQDKRLASFEDRCSWCEALAQSLSSSVEVCRAEADLPIPSYTIDTLRYLRQQHPQHQFRLVVGSDVLPQLPLWRDWASIEAEFEPLIVARAGYPMSSAPESPVFPAVSSSEIRHRLAQGQSVKGWVPQAVLKLMQTEDRTHVDSEV